MLEHYLQSLNDFRLEPTAFEEHQYGRSLTQFTGQAIDLKATDIALLSWRMTDYKSVRNALYQLTINFGSKQVVDLGLVHDSKIALIEVIDLLLQKGVFPIVISTNQEALLGIFEAYEQKDQALRIGLLDSHIPFSPYTPKALLNQLLAYHPKHLEDLTCLGHQSYLVDPKATSMLKENYFECYRLGTLQQQIEMVEPLVRDIDIAAFNLRAVKGADMPAAERLNPNGFTAPEICRIVRYSSMSDRLSALCLYGFDLAKDHRDQGSQLLAQLIWFAVQGFYARLHDYPINKKKLKTYVVDSHTLGGNITFFKSTTSNRWWLEVPKRLSSAQPLIACSYQDYQRACEGELPDRLLHAILKQKEKD